MARQERPVSYEGDDAACTTGHLSNQGAMQISNAGGWILRAQYDVKVEKGLSERKVGSILIFCSGAVPHKLSCGLPGNRHKKIRS
mgnify:CR=1 FL=1